MTSTFIHSVALAAVLLAAPAANRPSVFADATEPEQSSALVEVTPIIIDQVVGIVCDYNMDHIWIYTAGGALAAEREGSLGTQQYFDFSDKASGFYTVVVNTAAGTDSERFYY